ncbi:MAG: hypothetical protein QOK09_3165, partial [Mycobacterium sp.]|nr:hypothetical protein [Mycobacterium sp.]
MLTVGEVRRSLLDERGHSFGLVVGRESRMKHSTFIQQTLG